MEKPPPQQNPGPRALADGDRSPPPPPPPRHNRKGLLKHRPCIYIDLTLHLVVCKAMNMLKELSQFRFDEGMIVLMECIIGNIACGRVLQAFSMMLSRIIIQGYKNDRPHPWEDRTGICTPCSIPGHVTHLG